MDQKEEKSRYQREREYRQRKEKILEERRKTLTRQIIAIAVIVLLAVLFVCDYIIDKTTLGHRIFVYGLKVSGLTAEKAAQKTAERFADTELVFEENGETVYRTTLGEAGYSLDVDALTQELAKVQKERTKNWQLIDKKENVAVDYKIRMDGTAVAAALSTEHFDTGAARTESSDAYLEYDSDEGEFVIVDSVQGNKIDPDRLLARFEARLNESFAENLIQKTITIELGTDVYQAVEVTASSEELTAELETLNQSLTNYQNISVTYLFGSTEEVLDSDTICSWLIITDDGVELDASSVRAYIDELAARYNTMYIPRSFTTSYGTTVEISNNEFGYQIDNEGEFYQLCEDLESGESVEREPVYSHEGLYRNGKDDLCGCYIEVSLDNQHLWVYKDYALVTDTDIVSGYPSEERETFRGAWPIAYKASPYTLSSEEYGYEVEVNYWMPFVNGQGLHDATWQGYFGGEVYKTSAGSHGCINLPLAQAEIIYNWITTGYPIIIY